MEDIGVSKVGMLVQRRFKKDSKIILLIQLEFGQLQFELKLEQLLVRFSDKVIYKISVKSNLPILRTNRSGICRNLYTRTW